LKFYARCHSEDGDRDRLYQVQSHPIRVMVDFGYMPPNRRLKPEEVAELKAWLEQKPLGSREYSNDGSRLDRSKTDATRFIRLNALRLKVVAKVSRNRAMT